MIKIREKYFKGSKKMETVLKLQRRRNLTLEGNITVFKSLSLSKLISSKAFVNFERSCLRSWKI